jgi:acetolactate synthase small subunit
MTEGRERADVVFVICAHRRRGVLARIAGTFDRRGLTVRTLTADAAPETELSTVVVGVDGPCAEGERVAAALRNLVDVLSVELSAGRDTDVLAP